MQAVAMTTTKAAATQIQGPARSGAGLFYALDRGIEASRGGARHKAAQLKAVHRFRDFINERHPGVSYWSEVTPGLVRQFVAWCEAEGLSARTIRAYVNPLRLAARWNEEAGNEQANLRFTRLVPQLTPCEKRYLTAPKLAVACAYAKKEHQHLALLALLLAGVCAMRLSEVARLRRTDLDVAEAGCLYIHDAKNYWSERLIPLPPTIAAYCRVWFAFRGDAVDVTQEGLGKALKRCLVACGAETGDPTFAAVAPKDAGRKTGFNLGADAGCPMEMLRAYAGHAPLTTFERSYADLRALPSDLPDFRARKLALLRRDVADRLESTVQALNIGLMQG